MELCGSGWTGCTALCLRLRVQFARGCPDGEHPLFKHADCRVVGLQMRRVDHDALGLRPFARKPGEDTIENTEAAPGDEAVVERFVRTIVNRRVLSIAVRSRSHRRCRLPRAGHRPAQHHEKAGNGDIRAIWRSLSRNKLPITASSSENVNHVSDEINWS